jgi:hypothetical protein
MQNRKMVENAEAYRATAKRDREKGGSTIKVYTNVAAMDKAQGGADRDPLELFIAELRARWADACNQARADFQWEAGGEDVPF